MPMPRKTMAGVQADGPIAKFSISCPRELVLAVERHCQRYGYTSRSMFIRRAISDELERDQRRMRMD